MVKSSKPRTLPSVYVTLDRLLSLPQFHCPQLQKLRSLPVLECDEVGPAVWV